MTSPKKTLKEESLTLHKTKQGKLRIVSSVSVKNKHDLSLVYSPGVAEPCKQIQKHPNRVYDYTIKGHTVAVVSDGSAVLGLGNIGPLAGLPVMEGKAVLFKEFANIDAVPIMLDTQNPEEIIQTVKMFSPSYGGINLEDIQAPKCVYIERRLKKELNIPIFHDDQHGTAIVTAAALINASKLANKPLHEMSIVISGTGAAGSSIARLLHEMGIKNIYGYNLDGIVTNNKYNQYSFLEQELLDEEILQSPSYQNDSLTDLIKDKDVFIGVSAKNIVSKEMIESMNTHPIVFAMANPDPEIRVELAKEANAFIIGTGRSDYPNQINNVLAFPGLFKGALEAKATAITESMKLVCAKAIASIIKEEELTVDYIIPSPFDKRVVPAVSKAVKKEVKRLKIYRK